MRQMNCVWYRAAMKLMNIRYGKNLRLYGVPAIFCGRSAKMEIGDNVRINSSFLSNLIGLYCRTVIIARHLGAEVKIGNNVGISGTTIYARKSITIGDDTIIGGNVKILDNDFHPVDPACRNPEIPEKIGAAPIVIGKNCFIGCNSLILKGVHIGDNAVVGAGSVVSKDVPANCVVAGNPAVIVKEFKKAEEA